LLPLLTKKAESALLATDYQYQAYLHLPERINKIQVIDFIENRLFIFVFSITNIKKYMP